MTITINLSPDLEQQLRQNATAAGIDAQSYVASVLAADLARAKLESASAPRLSEAESRLLLVINEGMPQESWRRYHELNDKRLAETITNDELCELRSLTDVIELANARRLERLIELAQLRKIKLGDLMEELGIRDPGYV